jgi:thermitase
LAIESAANGRYGLGVPIFWAVNNRNVALSLDPVCSLPGVIAVGKSNEDGYVFRCARGEKLEFLAPGVNVIGPALWTDNDDWTGTSFATPLAAGVAALVLQKHPEWTAAQVLQRLRNTCDMPLHPANQNDRYGHGRINAYRAVYEPA